MPETNLLRARSAILPEVKAHPECIVIDTTYKCNTVCHMCHLFAPGFETPEVPHVSMEMVDRLIPLIEQTESVFLLGHGEPLMHPNFYQILERIRSANPRCIIAFTSNGMLLNGRNIDRLIELKVSQLNISIDGPQSKLGHPKVDLVYKNLRNLAQRKKERGIDFPEIKIGTVLGLDNRNDLLPILEFCIEIGATKMSVTPMRIVAPNPEYDDLIRQNDVYTDLASVVPIVRALKQRGLEHGIDIDTPLPTRLNSTDTDDLTVDHSPYPDMKCDRPFVMSKINMNGTVSMCQSDRLSGYNVNSDDPLAIWNSDSYVQLRQSIANESYRGACRDCHTLRNRLQRDAAISAAEQNLSALRLEGEHLLRPDGSRVQHAPALIGTVDHRQKGGSKIHISGWTFDPQHNRPCEHIMLFGSRGLIAMAPSCLRRDDVVTSLKNDRAALSGFELVVSEDRLSESGTPLAFVALSTASGFAKLNDLSGITHHSGGTPRL